jgi:hypothetical protein
MLNLHGSALLHLQREEVGMPAKASTFESGVYHHQFALSFGCRKIEADVGTIRCGSINLATRFDKKLTRMA